MYVHRQGYRRRLHIKTGDFLSFETGTSPMGAVRPELPLLELKSIPYLYSIIRLSSKAMPSCCRVRLKASHQLVLPITNSLPHAVCKRTLPNKFQILSYQLRPINIHLHSAILMGFIPLKLERAVFLILHFCWDNTIQVYNNKKSKLNTAYIR